MAINLDTIAEKLHITNQYGVRYQDPDARLDGDEVKFLVDKYQIMTDVHPTCISCQARQLSKYASHTDKNGKPIDRFLVNCEGIPRSLPPGSAGIINKLVADGMPRERALLNLKATIDPVAWAELMFGFDDSKKAWHLRSYQKEQLRCSSQNIVIREGRRSGKTFIAAVKLLYLALTREVIAGYDDQGKAVVSGPTIMIVTPYQAQILNIFDELERLIKLNKDLKKRVTTGTGGNLYVKTPFMHMDFENGSVIKGFVAGVGKKVDGSGGGTMRGQNAQVIYLDEMDMIPDDVLEKVVMPILLTDLEGKVTLIATSTPIGKRGKFYKWCLESPQYKEDHLPSTVLPQWNKISALIENENTEESFKAEYMALFIDGGYGVFKPTYIYGARQDYKYSETAHNKWWTDHGVIDRDKLIICIGIDWNKNAGTEFCVTAYDPISNRYIVCETINITANEFSSIRWKEEVVRLNYKWQPHYIYADEGYGHTIIEDLKLMSYQLRSRRSLNLREQATAKLADRLVAFNFSQRVELRNPIDNTLIVKSGKEFLVENAVRMFEDQIIWISVHDDILKKELEHYVILRRTPSTNRPIYGPDSHNIGDHRLDALMLSLGGIQLEQGLYSGSFSLSASTPSHFSQEALQSRGEEMGNTLEGLNNVLKKNTFAAPGALQVLSIARQGGNEDSTSDLRVGRRTRGKERFEGKSVRDTLLERAADYRGFATDEEARFAQSQPSKKGPKRKSRGRGWER
jgi:hypothetical protein